MRRRESAAAALMALVLVGGILPSTGNAQDPGPERSRRATSSFDRSYQVAFDTGYTTGYGKGEDDSQTGKRHNIYDFREYRRGDENYNDRMGDRDQYKLGYQAGFEKGYDDGLNGRAFGSRPGETRVSTQDPNDPNGGPMLKRGNRNNGGGGAGAYDPQNGPDPADTAGGADPNYPDPNNPDPNYPDPNGADPNSPDPNYPDPNYPDPAAQASRRAGHNMVLVIELDTPISTRHSKVGDRFSAHVVEPQPYAGVIVEGHIGKLEKPGRVNGKGEIVLNFDRMVYPDGGSEPLQAQVEEIIGYPNERAKKGGARPPWDWGKDGGGNRNDDIDARAGGEGQIEGEGSRNRDVATVGGGAVAGAVLGGILGGGSGAAIGAVLGGAAGGGVVAGTKGSHIDLQPGAQLRIRTGQPARVN